MRKAIVGRSEGGGSVSQKGGGKSQLKLNIL
jgi:hypothetical protein